MQTRRQLIIALGTSAVTVPLASLVQAQPVKVARIGFLGPTSIAGYESRVDALRTGLREFGYIEGKNLVLEFRWADGVYERLPSE